MAQWEMNARSLRYGLIAAVACILPFISPAAMAEYLYCDLAAPPASAVVAEDLGHTIYIFPDTLPEKFSGCKTWWIETGEKYFVFLMKDGRVIETVMVQEQTKQPVTCTYHGEKLAKDAPEGCMDFANAQSFAEHAMGSADAPKIPEGKDIRTEDPL